MTLRGERGAQAVSYSVGETRSRKWLERPSKQFVRGAAADPDMTANPNSASECLRRALEAGTSIATGTTKNTSNSWTMRRRVATRD
jgi:hypothetical protein